jgi:hypothetical protein
MKKRSGRGGSKDEDSGRAGGAKDRPEDPAGGGLPPGVEGTRGPKDSAERARRHYAEQRGTEPVHAPTSEEALADESEPEADDVESRGSRETPEGTGEFDVRAGSFGETFDEAERSLAFEMMAPMDLGIDLEEDDESRVMRDGLGIQAITLAISGVRTASQAGTQVAFRRTGDALALVLDIAASQELVNSGRRFDANFQIIDYSTNAVRRSVWTRNSAFSLGTHFWISQGNNWGPAASYTTPEKWGLPVGLYALRGTIEVLGIGTFAFSSEHPFRVR